MKPILFSRPVLLLLAALIVLKGIWYLADHQPRFYLGDSAAYLVAGLEKAVPEDRSYSYGLFLRRVAVKSNSLQALVAAQALLSALCCWMLAIMLVRFFRLRLIWAASAALACALAPVQLWMERYLLTETLCLFALTVVLFLALSYLRRPFWLKLLALHLAALGLISLRVTWLPLALSLAALPAAAWLRERFFEPSGRPGKRSAEKTPAAFTPAKALVHLGLSAALLLTLHGIYRTGMGRTFQRPPAYLYQGGFVRMAALAPLLRPGDAASEAVEQVLSEPSRYPLDDPRLRLQQRYAPGGLIDRLCDEVGDQEKADRLAFATARRAIRRDPLGYLLLGARTAWTYLLGDFDEPLLDPVDFFDPAAPWLPRELRRRFDFEPLDYPDSTLTQRYYQLTPWWPRAALLASFLGLAALLAAPGRYVMEISLLSWAALSNTAVVCLYCTNWSDRHMHQLEWLLILLAALALHFAKSRREHRPPRRE